MITTTTENLAPAIALAAKAASRTTQAITSCILLRSDGDTLHVQATDYDLTASASVAVSASAPVHVAIPAAALFAVVAALPRGATVTLDQPSGASSLTVQAGGSVWHLTGVPAVEWPAVDTVDVADDAQALPDLSPVVCAVSSDESRPALNGICIGGGVAVATDGHRLHTAPAVDSPDEPVIVHRRALSALSALGAPLRYAVEVGQVGIAGPVGSLTVRRPLEAFPDWKRVVPTTSEAEITADADALRSAVRTCTALLAGKHALLRLEVRDGDALTVSTTHPDLGDAQAEVSVQCDSDTVGPIGCNPAYLLDALAAVAPSGGEVRIGCADSFAPMVVRGVGAADGPVAVVMPMRL